MKHEERRQERLRRLAQTFSSPRAQREAKRRTRAKVVFAAAGKYTGDYLESKVDYLARMIINDVVSEGKLFRDTYSSICTDFCLQPDEIFALQHSLIRHGWTSAYNNVGASCDSFNVINEYYIAPSER